MHIQKSFSVALPPEQTFGYLADIENEARWNPWAIEVRKITAGPVGVGSRFSGRYKRLGVVEQEIATYEPPSRVVYLSNTMGAATMTFELQPDAAGTRVKIIGEANPPGLLRLMDPLLSMMMRRHMDDLVWGISRELRTEMPTPAAT